MIPGQLRMVVLQTACGCKQRQAFRLKCLGDFMNMPLRPASAGHEPTGEEPRPTRTFKFIGRMEMDGTPIMDEVIS